MSDTPDANTPNPTGDSHAYAIVEQMGHARFGARVREITRFGLTCMEATVLATPEIVTLVSPASIFRVTFCNEAVARQANRYGTTGLPALTDGSNRTWDGIEYGRGAEPPVIATDDIPFTVGQRLDIGVAMDGMRARVLDWYRAHISMETGSDPTDDALRDENVRIALSVTLDGVAWDVEVLRDVGGKTTTIVESNEYATASAEAALALFTCDVIPPEDTSDSLPPPPPGFRDF